MQYSNIRSRAGLVALVFALIISFVSAIPIPSTEFGLSSTTLSRRSNGQDIRVQPSTVGIPEFSFSGPSRMSSLPAATRTLASRETIMDSDDQLVRRSKVTEKIKHAFQKFGSLVKHGFQKAGSVIKKGLQKAGNAIKKGFVTAAKKVWHFVKTTGAKVVKFGLKVVETIGNAVGKVLSFIPGVGKPLDQAIEGISKVAGVISDHIHAKLGKKLLKGEGILNAANKIIRFVPRRRDLSEEEAFQQRDINEANYFEDIYERYDLD